MFQQHAFSQTKFNANSAEKQTLILQVNKYNVRKDSELRNYLLKNTKLMVTYSCIPEGIIIIGYNGFEEKSGKEYIKSKLFEFDNQLEYNIVDTTDLKEIENKCARTRIN